MSLICSIVCEARYFVRQVANSVLTCVTSTMATGPPARCRHKIIALFLKSSHLNLSIKSVRFFFLRPINQVNVLISFWRTPIYWHVFQVAFCSTVILMKMPWAFLTWCTASVKMNFLHDDVLQWRWRQGWEPAFRPERYVTQYPVLFSHLNAAQTLAC